MDAIHDLGGMQGFGPIPIATGDKDFAALADWEKRMWGLARSGVAQGVTIDWFRHGLERMVPSDYLSFAYFNKWCANYLMLMLDHGSITLEDVKRGHLLAKEAEAAPKSIDDVLASNAQANISFEGACDTPPAFAAGDAVRTLRIPPPGAHTRLPRYARGVEGRILAHHGAHAVPERGAEGKKDYQALYTVAFSAADLWGPEADPRDDVTLDLWEAYLVPA